MPLLIYFLVSDPEWSDAFLVLTGICQTLLRVSSEKVFRPRSLSAYLNFAAVDVGDWLETLSEFMSLEGAIELGQLITI